MRIIRMLSCAALVATSVFAGPASAASLKPPFDEIGIDQHIGDTIPLDLVFRDEDGRAVKIGDYFGDRPVILSLAYYRCPMLCSLVQSGLASSMKGLGLEAGKDYRVITVSIDPRETPDLATVTKKNYLQKYGRPEAASAWRFLTGEEDSIHALAGAAGFRYVYDEENDQFAHASGVMVLTPEGKLAQYFFGVEYAPRDLRLALVEASDGKVGSIVDHLLLLCYQYDPQTSRYGLMVYRLMRFGGVITVLGVGVLVLIMLRRDSRQAHGKPV